MKRREKDRSYVDDNLELVWFVAEKNGAWSVTTSSDPWDEIAEVKSQELAEHIVNCHNAWVYHQLQRKHRDSQ